MRLRSLSLNQFKKFTTPTRLDGISDALNLVVGPNELGKSTLLDALRAVLFERYSSRARPIMALQNDRSGAAPVVELAFEVDGGHYVLTKRFVKSPYAQLRCPDELLLEGDAAEAELRRLLGFSEAGSRGANLETLGMWGVLWVQQGQSFGRPNLPDSALASLSAGLESEVGTVLGGRRGRELPQAIEQRLAELVTPVRRDPRGPYREALQQAEQIEQQLIAQQAQRIESSEALEQLALAEHRLSRLEDRAQDELDADELRATRQRLAQEDLLDSRIEAAESDLRLRREQLGQAQQALELRVAARTELETEETRLAAERQRLATWQEQDRGSAAQLETLRGRVREAEAAAIAAEAVVTDQRAVLDSLVLNDELQTLAERRNGALNAQLRIDQARRDAEAIRATDDAVQRVRRAANALDRVEAQIGGVATRVSFEISSDQLAGIEVDGRALTDPPLPIESVEPVVIVIPERGRIVVDPSVADREQLLEARRSAQTEWRAALDASGANSLADAELQRERRRELEQSATVAQQQFELLAPEGGAALDQRIEGLRARLTVLAPEPPPQAALSRQELEAVVSEAEQGLREARDQERAARAAAAERDQAVAGQREQIRALQGEIGYRTERVERLGLELRQAEADHSDDQLAQDRSAAEQQVSLSESVAAALTTQRSAAARPQLHARISRLEQVIRERERARAQLRTDVARLRERVELHDSAGIDEAIEHSQHQFEQAAARRDRLQRELDVLDLLLSTLREAEYEAKERYLAPVLDRVRPYLQMLFANAEISMDEDLQITGMSRRRGYEERFDHLSMGTQEQIAVLVRLAFAEMLVDQGAPAAVILDDALVFSDDQRMSLMFDILSHAAQRVQIIVFTCREQLFEGLGAHQLQLAPADPESLRSA